MRRSLRVAPWVAALLIGSCARPDRQPAAPEPPVLSAGHSHNDYEHSRPLQDALDRGFCSIEADVHLVDGELLVAHDRNQCVEGRTLRTLYLDPLLERARTRRGRIYASHDQPLTLLVDLKSDGVETYLALHRQIEPYRGMLTQFKDGAVTPGAVTIVISGNIPRRTIADQSERWAFADGRRADLDAEPPAPTTLVPLVSMPWRSEFTWVGAGPIPEDQRAKLARLVSLAHARGYRIRFWGTPGTPSVWSQLSDAGVDLINVDDLDLGATFLRSRP